MIKVILHKYHLPLLVALSIQSLLFFPALVTMISEGRSGFYLLMTLNLPSAYLVAAYNVDIGYLVDRSVFFEALLLTIIFMFQFLFWFIIVLLTQKIFRKARSIFANTGGAS